MCRRIFIYLSFYLDDEWRKTHYRRTEYQFREQIFSYEILETAHVEFGILIRKAFSPLEKGIHLILLFVCTGNFESFFTRKLSGAKW
jgi:hypothetical protein